MRLTYPKNLVAPVTIAPALVLALVVFVWPIADLFLASVNAPNWSLGPYVGFFGRPANLRVLWQTIEIAAVATGISALIGYPVAYIITHASRGIKTLIICAIVIPYLTSLLVRTYAWVVILGDQGLINSVLLRMGLIDSPLPLIYNRTAVYLGMVHIMLPVMVLPQLSVMAKIDQRLVMAARSMGAGKFAAFARVFFPLSLPGLKSGCLLVFILSLGFYITPAALGGLKDAMLSNFIAAQVETSFNLGRIAASAFVLLFVAAVLISLVGLDLGGDAARDARVARPGRVARLWRIVAAPFQEWLVPSRQRSWATRLMTPDYSNSVGHIFATLFVVLVLSFLLLPSLVVVIMSFSSGAFLEFPPKELSLQWYRGFFGDPSWTTAMSNSLVIGAGVVLIATTFGTAAAYGLSKAYAQTRRVLTLILLMPIILPVIVVAIAAYLALAKYGMIGSVAGLILAHSIGAVAFVVVIVSATLSRFDTRLELAAMSMKASPLTVFRRITFPIIRPGIVAGALFAFIHSFDEVVISSLVSGMTVRTLPLKMWENMRHQVDPTIAAVASLLVALPILWFLGLFVSWKISQRRRSAFKPT